MFVGKCFTLCCIDSPSMPLLVAAICRFVAMVACACKSTRSSADKDDSAPVSLLDEDLRLIVEGFFKGFIAASNFTISIASLSLESPSNHTSNSTHETEFTVN